MDARNNAASVLVRKLDSIADLSDEDRDILLRLPVQITTVGADEDIVRDGDRPSRCCVVLEGFACRYKLTGEGKRQILSFHTPGDIPDLQSLHLEVMDHSLGTLTRTKVGFISHESLNGIYETHPRIAAALWRDTLIDAAIFREWITNIGRRNAYQRIAHVLCEILVRLRAVGATAEGDTFDLPVTQAELADAQGLSTVHVNRTLQELRAAGLITMKDGRVKVDDWEGLRKAGEFDPGYLHIKRSAAA